MKTLTAAPREIRHSAFALQEALGRWLFDKPARNTYLSVDAAIADQ